MIALPHEFNATQYLCPVYFAISTSHFDTVEDAASLTLYRYIRPVDISETASSIPLWGTGSGVFMSREITVRIGLVIKALVVVELHETVARMVARANLVNLVAGMIMENYYLFY